MKFIRALFLSLALPLLLVSARPLCGQTGTAPASLLNVEVGDAYEYEGFTRTELTMSMPDADSLPKEAVSEAALLHTMEVEEVTDEEIRWGVSAITTMTDPEGSGQPRTIPVVMTLVTDRAGRMKTVNVGGEEKGMGEGGLMSMMNSSNGSIQGPGWFLPADLQTRKVGESWTETIDDTMSVAAMGGIDMDVVISVTTVYTYAGLLDTLGNRTVRLDWRVTEMQMDGTLPMPGSEMTVEFSGTGTGTGSAYYSLEDRMLRVQRSDMVMEQNIDMGIIGSQTMTMRMYNEQWRQD